MSKVLGDRADFLENVQSFELVSSGTANIVAAVLPYLELFVGVLLVCNVLIQGAFIVVSALLIVFIIAQLNAIALELPISCYCFSSSGGTPIGIHTVVRTVLFIVLALVGITASYLCQRQSCVSNPQP